MERIYLVEIRSFRSIGGVIAGIMSVLGTPTFGQGGMRGLRGLAAWGIK